MVIWKVYIVILVVTTCLVGAVHYPQAGSDASEEQTLVKGESSQQQEAEREPETDKSEVEKIDDKSALQEALNIVLSPNNIAQTNEEDHIKVLINTIAANNQTMDQFFHNMDNLSEDVCKRAQNALWDYVNDLNSDSKRKVMLLSSRQDEEVRWGYWNILKTKYMTRTYDDAVLQRRIRIIRERGINVPDPNSQEREDIISMQRIWNNALVCAYNTSCGQNDIKGFGGQYFFYHHLYKHAHNVVSIFKTSKNSDELLYYWKQFRDATGRKIRPMFNSYVDSVNRLARSDNFTDAGDVWRFTFDDMEFEKTVHKLWSEVRPLYKDLADYVREKLKDVYKNNINDTLPAHILGNLWGQEWQSIYHLVTPYPERKLLAGIRMSSRSLFDDVDEFYRSMGFHSLEDSYSDVDDFQKPIRDCIPSSHDMCDGVTFRIRWCGKAEPAVKSLARAATLLGQVQYYSHYSHLPVYFRNGPTPAFKIAFPNLISSQMTTPEQLKRLKLLLTPIAPELEVNHLMWVGLEKIPLMGYAYVLDSWRWGVFRGQDQWNTRWWEMRLNETGITPPVARDETDLDPAAKYHVVSHMQYITYLVAEILEFQILLSLCKNANQTGPLNKCSLYGSKDAGTLLSKGMRLGARKDWRTVLKAITGEGELSTRGFLEYFKPLHDFLKEENSKFEKLNEPKYTPLTMTMGVVIVVLAIGVLVVYFFKRNGLGGKISGALGISQNGSLDIAATEMSVRKVNEPCNGVSEAKV